MTTSTSTVEPVNLVFQIYSGQALPDPLPEITVTGPVDGIWTVTTPDDITQEMLDAAIASIELSTRLTENMQLLFDKISAGIPPNRDFLAISSPTAEENDTQIQALTRQVNALLILRSGDFYDISGT
jgi:hypothetical protein